MSKINNKKNPIPCNPNASKEVKAVMNYLSELSRNGIITGQHTQTMEQAELNYIQKITGKLPALCGFELLAYSPNINYETCDEICLKEVYENRNTLEAAWRWINEQHGLITLTWHWFAPLDSNNKGFYAENTTFDPEKAVQPGTEEYKALLSDMDHMADILQEFCDKKIPILWRPFHESEGTWFWWGSKGPEAARQLYRIMYDRYTNYHKLDNLIWVWNSPLPEGYPGDEMVDIISRDLYPPAHEHTDSHLEYDELIQITSSDKITALAEIGTIPSIQQLSQSRVPWVWFMTWSNEFGLTEQYTDQAELKRAYEHPYAVTLDRLPRLY